MSDRDSGQRSTRPQAPPQREDHGQFSARPAVPPPSPSESRPAKPKR